MSHASYQRCRHWHPWISSAMRIGKTTTVWSACLCFLVYTLRDSNNTHHILDAWDRLYLPDITSLHLSYEGFVLHPIFPPFDKPNLHITEFACYTSIHLQISRSQTLKVISSQCCDPCWTSLISNCHPVMPPPFCLKQCASDTQFLSATHRLDPDIGRSLLPGFLMPTSFCWLTPCIHVQGLSLAWLWNTLLWRMSIILYEGPIPHNSYVGWID